MSRFIILLGGELVRTPRLDAPGRGRARHRGRRRHAARQDAGRHAGTLGRRLRFRAGRTRRPSSPAVPRRIVSGRTRTRPTASWPSPRRSRAARLAGAGRRLRRRARRPRLPASGAGDPAAPKEGTAGACSPAAHRKAVRCCPARATSTTRTARCSASSASRDLSGLTVTGAKWPLDRVEVPFGSSLTISNEVRGRPAHLARRRPRAAACPSHIPGEDF